MRVRLLKSWTHYGKKYPVGQVITTTEKLVEKGIAEKYDGPNPIKKHFKKRIRLSDLKI